MDTQGDAFFAVFASPRACTAAVLQLQQALQDHDWPGGEQVRVRVGIHSGEAEQTATGLVGLAAAHGGYFLPVAETAASHLTGPDQGSWLTRLDADQANLRHAAQYAAGRPDRTAAVLRLGVALERYWQGRSRQMEAVSLLGPAFGRPDAGADPALFAAALTGTRRLLSRTRRSRWSPKRSPAPNGPAITSSTPACTTTPAARR